MIPLDKLRSITHLITHGPACPDGIASALIIKDALPDVKVSFMSYGSEEHKSLAALPGTLFCDFTPWLPSKSSECPIPQTPVEEYREAILKVWLDAGAICLDHHPTARDIVEAFGENGVFGLNEKNECGAWLAYTQVWRPLCELRDELVSENYPRATSSLVEDFAKLAAIRDTWKKDDPRWQQACAQAAALIFFPFEDIPSLRHAVEDSKEIGSLLLKKQLSAAQRSLEESHLIITPKGTELWMFQGVSTTSDAAELAEKAVEKTLHDQVGPSQPDLVVGFHYRHDAGKLQLQFSMRSHTGFDCASFAKAHGGGGHKAAAGFTVEVSPEVSVNPYRLFELFLGEWEGGQ